MGAHTTPAEDTTFFPAGQAKAVQSYAVTDRQLSLQTVPGLWPPSWPMGLTMLRLLLLPVFLYLLLFEPNKPAHAHRWWAVGVFAIMAATDKLDGYLARKLNQTSKIGTILDPVADKLLVASSVVLRSEEHTS